MSIFVSGTGRSVDPMRGLTDAEAAAYRVVVDNLFKTKGGPMARQHIFEYAVIYHPRTSKKDEEGAVTKKSEIIQDVKRVLASDVKEVGILAARDIPEKYLDKLDTVEIAIRPF